MLVDSLLAIGNTIITRIFPDPTQRAQAQLELAKLQQEGELKQLEADVQLALAQTDINKIEAANSNIFVSGGRPFIIWICGFAFAYHFILRDWLVWIITLSGSPIAIPPDTSIDEIQTVLFGILGLGSMRTFEKYKGVANNAPH